MRWETDGVPDASAPPQQVLNRQIVDESDFGVALFWARLGTPTGTHAAGSLEEIEQLQRRGARVLIYFKNAPVPQELLKDDQYARVSEFKIKMEKEGLLGTQRRNGSAPLVVSALTSSWRCSTLCAASDDRIRTTS